MIEEPNGLRLECLDDQADVAQILKYYAVENFERELHAMDGLPWKPWLRTVLLGFPAVATFVLTLSQPEHLWLRILALFTGIEILILLHQQRARKREEVLVRCVRALIKAVSAREAGRR